MHQNKEGDQIIETDSPAATVDFGKRLARFLYSGMTVALYGDLGTGKTQFARGVAEGLGVEDTVTSPTFTIVQEYRRPFGNWLYHLDLYRVPDVERAMDFGIDEYLFNAHGITLIEWPGNIEELLFQNVGCEGHRSLVVIRLEHLSEASRRITVKSP